MKPIITRLVPVSNVCSDSDQLIFTLTPIPSFKFLCNPVPVSRSVVSVSVEDHSTT